MFSKKKYTDAEIVQGIKADNEVFINYLYDENFSLVKYGCKRYKLTEQDSLDCYTDAYMEMLKKIRQEDFSTDQIIEPLFMTKFKGKCVDQFRRLTNNKVRGTDPLDELIEMGMEAKSALEQLITKDLMDKLRPFVLKLSENCQKILDLWSYDYSHKEIATLIPSIGSDQSSKTTLNRCLSKLRKSVHGL